MSKFKMLILIASLVSLMVFSSASVMAEGATGQHSIVCIGDSYANADTRYIHTYGGWTECSSTVGSIELDIYLEESNGSWVERDTTSPSYVPTNPTARTIALGSYGLASGG